MTLTTLIRLGIFTVVGIVLAAVLCAVGGERAGWTAGFLAIFANRPSVAPEVPVVRSIFCSASRTTSSREMAA